MYKDKNEVRWSPVALDTLLDVEGIVAYWAPRGLVVHRTPALLRPFPDLYTQPEAAYPQYQLGGLDPELITRCVRLRVGGVWGVGVWCVCEGR